MSNYSPLCIFTADFPSAASGVDNRCISFRQKGKGLWGRTLYYPQGDLSTSCGFVDKHFGVSPKRTAEDASAGFWAKNMQGMHREKAGIQRWGGEYIRVPVFSTGLWTSRTYRPQLIPMPKCGRCKALGHFSTVSTCSTPTAAYIISTSTVCALGCAAYRKEARSTKALHRLEVSLCSLP